MSKPVHQFEPVGPDHEDGTLVQSVLTLEGKLALLHQRIIDEFPGHGGRSDQADLRRAVFTFGPR